MSTEQKAHELTEKVSDNIHHVVDKAAETMNRASDKLYEKKERLMETEGRIENECRVFVKENPVTALAIAAGIGFLISRITR